MRLRPLGLDRQASFGITSSVDDAKPGANTLKICYFGLNVDQIWMHKLGAQVGCTRRNHIASSDEGCDSATGVPSNAQHGTSVVSPLNGSKSSQLLPMPFLG